MLEGSPVGGMTSGVEGLAGGVDANNVGVVEGWKVAESWRLGLSLVAGQRRQNEEEEDLGSAA